MSFPFQNVNSKSSLKAVDGTTRPAIDIFAHAIRFLKSHLIDAIKLETGR